jgi:histidinol-phosphatase
LSTAGSDPTRDNHGGPAVPRELLDEAVALARRAGEVTLGFFGDSGLVIEEKSDGTPVTEADRAAERLLREELARSHPGDGVFGEEEGEKVSETGRRWIIDPLDGTKAFTRGVPLFANLVALEDQDGIAVGVINLPALGQTIYAGRGVGCFCNGAPARMNGRGGLPGSYLSSSGYAHWDEERLLRVKRSGLQLAGWGDGYGYALVATGRIEAMADPEAALYDLAPMPVILAEAGGRFTDWSGAVEPGSGTGLATNGRLHEDVLALLAS